MKTINLTRLENKSWNEITNAAGEVKELWESVSKTQDTANRQREPMRTLKILCRFGYRLGARNRQKWQCFEENIP